jgi:hypothetical protein
MGQARSVVAELGPEASALLSRFSYGEPFGDRIDALNRLITAKQIGQIARRPEFEEGLLRLERVAGDANAKNDRLLAVSRLGLLAATINLKPVRRRIQDGLRSALVEPLAPIVSLPTANDRLYVAQACAVAAHPWCPQYLSDAAITEETGENARVECLRALAQQIGDLQTVFEYIRGSLEKLVPETESPANSAGRRLRRILSALRPTVSRCRVRPGSEPGRVLAEILREPFRRYGRPDEAKVLEDLAGETFAVIHELMRAGFSLATEPSTYNSLRVAQSWFAEHKWQSLTGKSGTLELVVQDLREAIVLLAKQNVTDQELIDTLRIACGSREKARKLTADIGRNLSGLSTEVRRFLGAEIDSDDDTQLGRQPGEITSTSEMLQFADLLVEAEALYCQTESELKDPSLHSGDPKLRGVLARALSLADSARSLARRHLIELRGRVGEVVEFSQIEHEMAGGFQAGIRRVRIQRPTVVQMRGSAPHVIRKGLVEPL